MDPLARIEQIRLGHHEAVDRTLREQASHIAEIAQALTDCLNQGKTILSCGNGGSACDAMHFAGECVGRFVNDRKPLPAIALTADPGILSAIGNDYGFDEIFARQVRAHAASAGALVAISTSGKSPNVLRAMEVAKEIGLYCVLLTGERGKSLQLADQTIVVPSVVTAHIQETHITVLQLLIALIEDKMF